MDIVTYALAKTYTDKTVSKKPSYSTTEQIVATWIDGRPVYELTVDFGAGPAANGTKRINISIEGTVDKFISVWGMDNNADNSCIPIPCPGGSNNKIVIDTPTESNPYYNVAVLGSYNMTNCYIYLVLRYIKVAT